jgi:hypothetical protein
MLEQSGGSRSAELDADKEQYDSKLSANCEQGQSVPLKLEQLLIKSSSNSSLSIKLFSSKKIGKRLVRLQSDFCAAANQIR